MRRLCAICICIVVITAQGPLRAQEPQTDKVTINGETYTLYPAEKLRAKGANIPDVPRDQNAAYVYIDAINAMKPIREGNDLVDAENAACSGIWPEGEPGEYMAKWLTENKPALDLARRASAMPNYARPMFKGDNDSVFSILLPDLSPTRQLAKMLVMEGTLLAHQGNIDAAMDNYLTAQRMGGQVAHGCTLIEGLVGIAVQNLSGKAISQTLESSNASPELIKSTLEKLNQIAAAYPTTDDYLNRERFFSAAIVDDMIESPTLMGPFSPDNVGAAGPSPDKQDGWYKLMTALKRVYLPDRTIKKHLRQFYDDVIEASHGGQYSTGGSIDEGRIMARIPAWSVPARVLLPSLARVCEINLRAQSNTLRAMTKSAVSGFQKTHGTLPAALSNLVPEYFKTVPIDPMTGLELEFSIAPDGKQVVGLERVTSENEEAIRAKRRRPVIINARTSEWQKYVQSFKQDYKLSESQTAAADGILRSLESQAISYEITHGETIQKLRAVGSNSELVRETAPLDQMFEELKKRLDALPTAQQRTETRK